MSSSAGQINNDDDMSTMVQLVDGDGNFSGVDDAANGKVSVSTFLNTRKKFMARGLDYSIVAILGAQSSGKSTLLNLVFGTKFRVMNSAITRGRTTHGVWLGFPHFFPDEAEDSVVLLDVEGTDGSEREDDYSFERKTSLLSLALSSVLIVNMWCQDIGRYTAANLSLLRTVFELNLQLFQKAEAPRTLVLFVIRDHVCTPLEELEKILMKDLTELWNHLTKPAEFAHCPVTQFFEFKFTSLPHMILEPDKFTKAVTVLRDKFLNARNAEWYLTPKHRKDIPSDGLDHFAQEIWAVIKENKDLDLPSQKHMLATYRCEEILEQSYAAFVEGVTPMRTQLQDTQRPVENFGEEAFALYDKCITTYKGPASRYLAEVSQKKKQVLVDRLQKDLHHLFELQLSHIMSEALSRLDAVVSPFARADCTVPIEEVGVALTRSEEECVQYWDVNVQASIKKPDIEWPWEQARRSFVNAVADRLSAARSRQIDRLIHICEAEQSVMLGPVMSDALERCEPNMWHILRSAYTTSLQVSESRFLTVMRHGFKVTSPEEHLERFRAQTMQMFHSKLKQKVEYVSYKLEKRFNSMFNLDSRGLPRRWKTNDDIPKIFFGARASAESVLDLYCYMRMDPADDALTFLSQDPTGNNILLERPIIKAKKEAQARATSHSAVAQAASLVGAAMAMDTQKTVAAVGMDPQKVLLSHSDCEGALEDFRRTAETAYMQALRDQEQISSRAHVPAALIVLIAVLGFNEFKAIMFNPFLLLPCLVIGVLVYTMYALHLGGVLESAVGSLSSMTMSSLMDIVLRKAGESDTVRNAVAVARPPEKPKKRGGLSSSPSLERANSTATTTTPTAPASAH